MTKTTTGVVLAVAAIAMASGAQAQQRGVTASEVLFGMPTDLSGVAATYGVSSSNAVKMRFDEINEAGGIEGRKLKVIVEDQGYQVPKAVQACNKLINRDKVFGFVGALGTPMNNACFKEQFAAGVPNLFPLSAARSMYEPFERLKFYGAASYVDQIRSGIQYFVKEKGKKNVCVMYQDTDFGKEILEGAKEQTAKLGIKIVETTAHKPTDQDFTAPIGKLR
jgi:branched-chain amino acid transport system substrate-binding protein